MKGGRMMDDCSHNPVSALQDFFQSRGLGNLADNFDEKYEMRWGWYNDPQQSFWSCVLRRRRGGNESVEGYAENKKEAKKVACQLMYQKMMGKASSSTGGATRANAASWEHAADAILAADTFGPPKKKKGKKKKNGNADGSNGDWRNGDWDPSKGNGARPVTEGMRIDIAAKFEEFRASGKQEYTFPPGLTNHDRAIVHTQCRKFGFTSKSHGKDVSRRVTIYRKGASNVPERLKVGICPPSLEKLEAYYESHPMNEEEYNIITTGELSGVDYALNQPETEDQAFKRRRHGGERRSIAPPTESQAKGRWVSEDITRARKKLPIFAHREEILDKIRSNQIILLAGETGCGKTTQVPQYILEDCWGRGEACKILCSQPRRISATSVAERVSTERGEIIGQGAVGYQIRLEKRGGYNTALMFCTNGILLRILTGSTNETEMGEEGEKMSDRLDGITHIVMDEIHERDTFSDFLMVVLKDLLPNNPQLTVVLMSATIDINLFSGYFGNCPVIQVPGFTHPVQQYYLEDVLRVTGHMRDLNADSTRRANRPKIPLNEEMETAMTKAFTEESNENLNELLDLAIASETDHLAPGGIKIPLLDYQHSATGATALMICASKGFTAGVVNLLQNGADAHLVSNDGSSAFEWAKRFRKDECMDILERHYHTSSAVDAYAEASALQQYQRTHDPDMVDALLIEVLLEHIADTSDPDHAVLIFLPGWSDIGNLRDALARSPRFRDTGRFSVLPLHSQVASAEQRRVFSRPPKGVRKIVLSTNIAETAVTIDDIVFVINSGRLKEKQYDPYTEVSSLVTAWTSRASEKQRAGRAGRVRPGVAYHLYSRSWAASLPAFQMPEIKRSPLEELCLQVKLIQSERNRLDDEDTIAAFLGRAVEAPLPQAIETAVSLLKSIGAIDSDENLTGLGKHLASLPLHPLIGKLLIYASLFQCVDPVLTVACGTAYKDPFIMPVDPAGRQGSDHVRKEFGRTAGGGSDHLILASAYVGWERASFRGNEYGFARENYLSGGTMNMIRGMRSQIVGELRKRRLIAYGEHTQGDLPSTEIIRNVLGMGFYPMIGLHDSLYHLDKSSGNKPASGFRSFKGERIRLHKSSTLRANFDDYMRAGKQSDSTTNITCVAYGEVSRNMQGLLECREATIVQIFSLILVANRIIFLSYDEDEASGGNPSNGEGPAVSNATILIDAWLELHIELRALWPLLLLRLRLADAFGFKIQKANEQMPEKLQAAVETIKELLVFEASTSGASRGPENAEDCSQALSLNAVTSPAMNQARFAPQASQKMDYSYDGPPPRVQNSASTGHRNVEYYSRADEPERWERNAQAVDEPKSRPTRWEPRQQHMPRNGSGGVNGNWNSEKVGR